MKYSISFITVIILLSFNASLSFSALGDENVAATKHNLSVSGPAGAPVKAVTETEICVFCHTPHGSNIEDLGSGVRAPLWNRKLSTANYFLYDEAWSPTLYKGSIHILDTESDAIKDNIIIDGAASDIAVSKDGKILYISDIVNSRLIIMERGAKKEIKSIIVGNRPHRILLSPDGKILYAANYHSNNISVIDTESMDAIALIPSGILPFDIALSKDGRWLFSSNYDESSISIIDTKINRVVEKILVEIYPSRIEFASF